MRKLHLSMTPLVERLYTAALAAWKERDFEAAEAFLKKVLAQDCFCARAQLLQAYVYRDQGAVLSELHCLETLLPQLPEEEGVQPLAAAGWSLLGGAYNALGKNREAQAAFLRAAAEEPRADKKLAEYSNAIFVSNHWLMGVAELHALYTGYVALLDAVQPYEAVNYHHSRLRIGYVSADLRRHPVTYFSAVLFKGFDRERYAVYGYAANPPDEVTRWLAAGDVHWREVQGDSPDRIAAQIRVDEIDILFDLSGHTANNMLPVLAWRPAPVQVSGIGYMSSTGLPAVDYFLGDSYLDAVAQETFTERLLLLPQTHLCYTALQPMPEPCSPPCLRNGYVTFGCFNNFAKVTDEMLRLWAGILAEVPGSRLLLKHRLFNHTEGRTYAWQRLDRQGIPQGRVELRGLSADYLSQYDDMDIALDTYPYTGGLTTFEALFMGVPVVSLYGSSHGTRFGRSLLMNAGLGELSAATAAEYAARSIGLARDWELLTGLRQELRRMVARSPLMDSRAYMRAVEAAYEKIWKERWQKGECTL